MEFDLNSLAEAIKPGRVVDCFGIPKAAELGRFLTGRLSELDFTEPAPSLVREDDRELRAKILSLTSSEAKRLGIPKQSLHDLREKSKSSRSFKLYAGTRAKLAVAQG